MKTVLSSKFEKFELNKMNMTRKNHLSFLIFLNLFYLIFLNLFYQLAERVEENQRIQLIFENYDSWYFRRDKKVWQSEK